MKKILAGALIALAAMLVYRSCMDHDRQAGILKENSKLIQQQLQNVSKLVVTEGHFAEVYTYADSKELFGPLITADKKALVVVNAKVTIAYDLKQVEFSIDEATQTLRISRIPEPEITIHPDFEYYDVSADYLNPFEAEDYNLIKRKVTSALEEKVEGSPMAANAQNRLVSELAKLFVLTNSMGWTLEYENEPIKNPQDIWGPFD